MLKPFAQLSSITLLALGLAACGQESAPASVAIVPAATSASSPPHASHTAHATASAATAAAPASNAACDIVLGSNDAMQFSLKEITVPNTCQNVTLTLQHNGKLPKAAMGHNVVITPADQLNGVLSDALKAGKEHDYVMPNDARIVAHTRMLGGGESDTITLDVAALKKTPHVFVCTFPGHSGPMRGHIVVK